jgi:uncharacterized protein
MFFSKLSSMSLFTLSSKASSTSAPAIHEQKRHARRGLVLFFLLVFPLAVFFEGVTIVKQDAFSMFCLMWTPGLACLVTRLVLREGFSTVSFRVHGRRTWHAIGMALLIPVGIGLVAYGLAWITGITPFVHFHASAMVSLFLSLLGTHPSFPTLVGFAVLFAAAETISATGEELGWRGYLLTHLIEAGVPRPVLVSGLIWSLWHWPLILFGTAGPGVPRVVSASIFLVTITSLGYLIAQLRLSTGSIWPAIVCHAAWNSTILELFDSFTRGANTSVWTGEAGMLVALTALVTVFIFRQHQRHHGHNYPHASLSGRHRTGARDT